MGAAGTLVAVALLAAAVAASACAPAATITPGADGSAVRGGTGAPAAALLPAGHGTLRQDDITVSLRAGAVLLKVTPLDEATILTSAPDTYARLRALRQSRLAELPGVRAPELFLASFFSYEPDVAFQPEDVQLLHQARLLRPVVILPVTPGWGRQLLGQQETQMAVYVFDGPIEYHDAITVRYGGSHSDEWQRIVTRLEAERARILSRVR